MFTFIAIILQNIGRKHAPPVQYRFPPNKTGLDVNHTHFILVDNGTTDKFGTEIELRSRFEAIMAKQNTESSSAAGLIEHHLYSVSFLVLFSIKLLF